VIPIRKTRTAIDAAITFPRFKEFYADGVAFGALGLSHIREFLNDMKKCFLNNQPNQYKKPNNQSGILFLNPYSKSSAAMNEF